MRRVLLLSLSLALGFSAFAQQRVAKNDIRQATASAKKVAVGKENVNATATNFAPQTAKSVVINRLNEIEDGETMTTTYDLQSNHYCSNRMYQLPDGSVAIAATMSHEFNQSASDRGTGYNFYKGGEWGPMPESRIEDFRTGWPSIAPWKDGEILLCHGNSHMQCFVRDIAGEGEWRYMGPLPDYPEGYPYNEYPTWPRVVTCGENHDIIVAVGTLQHQVSSDEIHSHTVMWRSEDAENWTISYSPLAELGYEVDVFSADDYCMAANGHTVALLYSGNLTNSAWMFKSTDDGLTWETTKIWEHPFEGRSLDEVFDYGDSLFIPMNGAITLDNNNVAHVAFSTLEMTHTLDNEPGYYSYWSGRTVDGILYWNDTQEAPIQDTYHPEYVGTPLEEHFANPNPFHAARLWWPIVDEPGYVHMVPDSTRWIGYIPMYEGYEWDNDKFYHESDYYSRFYSASGHPALSCDPYGNLACAFSSPCVRRLDDNGRYYYRSIYVSYRNVDKGYWDQLVDDLTDEELNFMFLYSDNVFTVSVPYTYTPGEFWFGFQSDDQIGLYWGDSPNQGNASENTIHAVKVNPEQEYWNVPENYEAQDVVYGLYPNPATDYVVVKSSQDVEANISIVNLVGQTVKQFNKSLKMGENAISLDLKSGIYFCTISANGFNKTIKFVVK
jgi:hypothetical protein